MSEGMPGAVLEAMALGTCVIARDIPGNAHLIQDNVTGLLFRSSSEFIVKASELIDDETMQMNLQRNAQKYVAEHHTLEAERTHYVELFTTLAW
eukprot:m.122552 g.122552  ORF g.122552 m.122552 type:complete len:94 (-) comp13734_c1_seq5:44-325(-)